MYFRAVRGSPASTASNRAVQRQCKGPCRGSAAGVDLVARQTTRHSQVEGTAYYNYQHVARRKRRRNFRLLARQEG